jgi:hypothetical protein
MGTSPDGPLSMVGTSGRSSPTNKKLYLVAVRSPTPASCRVSVCPYSLDPPRAYRHAVQPPAPFIHMDCSCPADAEIGPTHDVGPAWRCRGRRAQRRRSTRYCPDRWHFRRRRSRRKRGGQPHPSAPTPIAAPLISAQCGSDSAEMPYRWQCPETDHRPGSAPCRSWGRVGCRTVIRPPPCLVP